MNDTLGLIIFLVIAVISILGKLKRKPEDEPQQPPSETPDFNDIPDILRRMFTGEAGVPKARPARPREVDDDEGWQPVPPVILQAPRRRESSYQPPVAQPAVRPVPETEGPVRPRPPIVVKEPVPAPMTRQAPRPIPRPAPQAVPPQPAPRPAAPPQPAVSPVLTRAQTLSVKSLRAPNAPKCKAPEDSPAQGRGRQQRHAACGLVSNLDDVRRGIILSEVLGPPVSMR